MPSHNRQAPSVRRGTFGVVQQQRASAHDGGHELPPPSIAAQLQAARRGHSLGAMGVGGAPPAAAAAEQALAPEPGGAALPDDLRAGAEALSGVSLDQVQVHFNSGRPAQLGALAFAQGSSIHLAPGQEQHLPHEVWHVVQQAQGRVPATLQAKGLDLNDDQELEREADAIGALMLDAGQPVEVEDLADAQADADQEPASEADAGEDLMDAGWDVDAEDLEDLDAAEDQAAAYEADALDVGQYADPEGAEAEPVWQHGRGLRAPGGRGPAVVQRVSSGLGRLVGAAVGVVKRVASARSGRKALTSASARSGRRAATSSAPKKSRPNGISTMLRNNLWNKKQRPGIAKKDWYTGYEAQHIIPYAIARDLKLPLGNINDIWNGMMLPSGRRTARQILYKAGVGKKGQTRPRHIKKGLAHPEYNKKVKSYIEHQQKALNGAPVQLTDMQKWADHIRAETKKLKGHQAVDDISL